MTLKCHILNSKETAQFFQKQQGQNPQHPDSLPVSIDTVKWCAQFGHTRESLVCEEQCAIPFEIN